MKRRHALGFLVLALTAALPGCRVLTGRHGGLAEAKLQAVGELLGASVEKGAVAGTVATAFFLAKPEKPHSGCWMGAFSVL